MSTQHAIQVEGINVDHFGDWLQDSTYLPYTAEELRAHFLSGSQDDGRHLAYYQQSLRRLQEHTDDLQEGRPSRHGVRVARQVEKDERFWTVTALMGLFNVGDEGRAAAFGSLLDRAGIQPPPEYIGDWQSALGDRLELFFEVNLPSPPAYSTWLRTHLDERTPIAYVRESVGPTRKLEGPTHADAVLIAPDTGVAVIVEAKVLSDVSGHVTFDIARNQIARNIDVALEPPASSGVLAARLVERTYFLLLTPQLFRSSPSLQKSRLYGWLLPEYQRPDGTLLSEHLEHRNPADLDGVNARLGWASWEDVNAIVPGACPWLL